MPDKVESAPKRQQVEKEAPTTTHQKPQRTGLNK